MRPRPSSLAGAVADPDRSDLAAAARRRARRARLVGRRRCAARWPGVPRLAWFGLVPAIGAGAGAGRLLLADGAVDPARQRRRRRLPGDALDPQYRLRPVDGLRLGRRRAGRQCGRRRRARSGLAARADRRRARRRHRSALLSHPARVRRALGWSGPSPTIPRCWRSPPRCWRSWRAFLVFDGLQYVFGAALRSLGEQVWAGVNGIIGFFIVTGGLGWLLVRRGWGPDGLAYAAGVGMLLVCACSSSAGSPWCSDGSRRSSRSSGSASGRRAARPISALLNGRRPRGCSSRTGGAIDQL